MPNKPSIFSFFSGAGFLDLGFENSGYSLSLVNELHPPFMEAYIHSRANTNHLLPHYGYFQEDVTTFLQGKNKTLLSGYMHDTVKTHDIIGFIGGPPCPDFSVGGKNRGREGDHGKLSATYIDLICQHKPGFFLFENVKGLWRTKIHREFFEEIKQKVHKAGYTTTERLINSIEFGAPQDRERIILIGFRDDILSSLGHQVPESKVLPDGVFPWDRHIKHKVPDVFSAPWPTTNPYQENSIIPCPAGIPEELTVEYWFKKNDVYNHPNAEHFFKPKAGLARFETVDEGDDSKKSFKRLHRWRYSPTACYGNNEVHLHPYKTRRISVAEALAIQSLPKDFSLPPDMSLSNMFKTVGNGVPFIAAKAIAQTILDFLGGV